MSTKTNVSTATVRAWAAENLTSIDIAGHLSVLGKNGDGTNVRGRVHPTVREAYNKAHSKSRKVYAEKVAESRTITFDVAMRNSAGRWYKKSVTIDTSAARVLLGQSPDPDKGQTRGRMSHAKLALAYAASKGLPVKE